MNESELVDYIIVKFPGVDVVSSKGDFFFIYDPDRTLPASERAPWASMITTDRIDDPSEREDYFRLNISLSKETFDEVFGEDGILHDAHVHDGHVHNGHRTATGDDQFFPHPVYGRTFWCTVVNPAEKTIDTVKQLLREAYAEAVRKYDASREGN